MAGDTQGTFRERLAQARRLRPGAYVHLFDGRPQVVISTVQLQAGPAIHLATAYGYRHLETRGRRTVRHRVFVPDPDPTARREALPPGTPFEVAAQHPAFQGATARAARNHAELVHNELNLATLIPVTALLGLGVVGAAAGVIGARKPVLLVPMSFGLLLIAAVVLLTRARIRKQHELLGEADRLTRAYSPHGFPARTPAPPTPTDTEPMRDSGRSGIPSEGL